MQKGAFTLVLVALLAGTAGSAVTYALMKREPGAMVAAVTRPVGNAPLTEAPPLKPVVNPPAPIDAADPGAAAAAQASVAADAPARVRKNQIRATIAGELPAPEVFEQTYFSPEMAVASPDELTRAVQSFGDQIASVSGYLETHKGAQTRLTAVQQTASALAASAGMDPVKTANLQAKLSNDLADLAKNVQNVADKGKETPESAAISAQIKTLAETIRRHMGQGQ